MDHNRRAEEDLHRDDAMFPAYTDYLYGLDLRPEVMEEPGLHSQLYLPEWATTKRPVLLRDSENIIFESRTYTAQSQSATVSEGPHAIDLRLPDLHSGIQLLPPQTVVPAPPPAPLTQQNLSTLTRLSSAELTRRKLLNTAPHGTMPTSLRGPTQLLGTDMPTSRPAREVPMQDPFTDHGNARGTGMPPSMFSQHQAVQARRPQDPVAGPATRPPQAPTNLQQQQSLQGPTTANMPRAQNGFNVPSRPQIDLIQPGELHSNPYFAAALGTHAQSTNTQLIQYWHAAQTHPNPEARRVAMEQVHAISSYTYQRVRARLHTQSWIHTQDQTVGPTEGLHRTATQQVRAGAVPQNGLPNGLPNLDGAVAQPGAIMQTRTQQASAASAALLALDSQERAFINSNLPALFSNSTLAYRQPTEGDVDGMNKRTQALDWINTFKGKLSTAGDKYLDNVVRMRAQKHLMQRHLAAQQMAARQAQEQQQRARAQAQHEPEQGLVVNGQTGGAAKVKEEQE